MRIKTGNSVSELVARAAKCASEGLCFISLKNMSEKVTITMQHPVAGQVKILAKFYDGPVSSM